MLGGEPSELALRYQPARFGHAGVTEVGGIGENGGEDRPRVVMRSPRRQMGEAASETGPAVHIGEQIGNTDRWQVRVERGERAFCFVGRNRAQR